MKLSDLSLALFFTRPFSLQSWEKGGMFDREVALYQKIRPALKKITFVTYGGKEDRSFSERLSGIEIVCNRWNWSEANYIRYLTYIFPFLNPRPSVYKSNQVLGAEVALASSRVGKNRFIARCGNIRSLNAEREFGSDSSIAAQARAIEESVFPSADHVVVTTREMSEYIHQKYHVDQFKISVIPNYVQTDLFKPSLTKRNNPQPHLIFVGRLELVKNLGALFEAIAGLNVSLTIVGTGSWQTGLKSLADELKLNVKFLGTVANNALPAILQSADIYIQPSLYEGHPKTILEAMACGKPVIAGNSPGIRELICHRKNGFLCGTSSAEIRSAVEEVSQDISLQAKMGETARRYIEENFSLERVAEIELEVLESVMK